MTSNWWMTLLEVLELLSPALVLLVIARRNLMAVWPSLTTALSFELISNVVLCTLLHQQHFYRPYFYCFWISSGVQAVLRLWITADIVRAIPGIGFFTRSTYVVIGCIGLVMAVASAAMTWHDPVTQSRIVGTVLLLNRAVNIAWIAFFVSVLAALKLLHIGWNPVGARITGGLVLRIGASALAAEFYTHPSRPLRLWGNAVESVATIVVLVFWAMSLRSLRSEEMWDEVGDSEVAEFTLRLLQQVVPVRER